MDVIMLGRVDPICFSAYCNDCNINISTDNSGSENYGVHMER